MDEAKAVRLLQCAERMVQMPEFATKEESDAWMLLHAGDFTIREMEAVLKILDLLDNLDV